MEVFNCVRLFDNPRHRAIIVSTQSVEQIASAPMSLDHIIIIIAAAVVACAGLLLFAFDLYPQSTTIFTAR
jgi:hypothetical protein